MTKSIESKNACASTMYAPFSLWPSTFSQSLIRSQMFGKKINTERQDDHSVAFFTQSRRISLILQYLIHTLLFLQVSKPSTDNTSCCIIGYFASTILFPSFKLSNALHQHHLKKSIPIYSNILDARLLRNHLLLNLPTCKSIRSQNHMSNTLPSKISHNTRPMTRKSFLQLDIRYRRSHVPININRTVPEYLVVRARCVSLGRSRFSEGLFELSC